MTECDTTVILTREQKKLPGTNARIITDNGKQFLAKEFKELVRHYDITQVRTNPY